MKNKKIHIVSLDVPFPADYGGAIDIFYRIKALKELEFDITLHCFEYGRGEQKELEKYTSKVFYYKRKKRVTDTFSSTPFIVKSRYSEELLKNLLLDDSPILFEGLHTTLFLDNPKLSNRIKIVRTHNVEHEYYAELAKNSTGLKKQFFKREAIKLEKHESLLKFADHILTIQENDFNHFSQFHKSVHLLPASSGFEVNNVLNETEAYALFHGNLSVAENDSAAQWILNQIVPISKTKRIIIAGKSPSKELINKCASANIELVANPTQAQMSTLLKNARIHLLYTEQSTGLKLKLLNALNTCGHVVVNDVMVAGSGLESICQIANSPAGISDLLDQCMQMKLEKTELDKRNLLLDKKYNTRKNCAIIGKLI